MLRWPDPEKLTSSARQNLHLFRQHAAKELEDDTHTWWFENWSWMNDDVAHFTVRNEAREERVYVVERDGSWAFAPSEVTYTAHVDDTIATRMPDEDQGPGRFRTWLRRALHADRGIAPR